VKRGIDSEKFFESLVEAWENQESTCENLTIRCRKKTRDHAIFLLTDGPEVVAQLPIFTSTLEGSNPLERLTGAMALARTKRERDKTSPRQIRDLKPGMKRVNLVAKVIEIPNPQSVITKFGGVAKVANASIADETGIIKLSLWGGQIQEVSVGDRVQVKNGSVVKFRGERQLRTWRGGQLSVVIGGGGEVDA
jgi:replication factor A1